MGSGRPCDIVVSLKFFMKATLLEQMRRDYIHIKQTEDVTRDQVERQEEVGEKGDEEGGGGGGGVGGKVG